MECIEPAARTVYAGVISIDTKRRKKGEKELSMKKPKKKKGDRGLECNIPVRQKFLVYVTYQLLLLLLRRRLL